MEKRKPSVLPPLMNTHFIARKKISRFGTVKKWDNWPSVCQLLMAGLYAISTPHCWLVHDDEE